VKGPTLSAHLRAILALPVMALVVIPALIYYAGLSAAYHPLRFLDADLRYIIAGVFTIPGSMLFIGSIDLFIRIGKGTLAPWNPTKTLVVRGLYRNMRNPMITGVICILTAEAFIFPSILILFWGGTFFLLNHVYFILKEEPGLLKRFGEEYREYKEHVPRWIPKLKGWRPEDQ